MNSKQIVRKYAASSTLCRKKKKKRELRHYLTVESNLTNYLGKISIRSFSLYADMLHHGNLLFIDLRHILNSSVNNKI